MVWEEICLRPAVTVEDSEGRPAGVLEQMMARACRVLRAEIGCDLVRAGCMF